MSAASEAVRLLSLDHARATSLLRGGAPVYLTINPVEYHGPHLSLHNDRLVSEGLVVALHEKLFGAATPLVVADDLEIGVEPTPGIGTRVTPMPIARALIAEACDALADLGATRVVLMTFHGAPLHNLAIEHGADRLRARGVKVVAPFNALMAELLSVDVSAFAEAYAHIEDEAERAAMKRDAAIDFHAGFLETSVALHLAPESVSKAYVDVPPCPPIVADARLEALSRAASLAGRRQLALELHLGAVATGWHALRPFPGYTGRPHRASARAGEIFTRVVVDRYAQIVGDVFAGRAKSPPPILRWSARLTLDGRLSPMASRARR